MQALVARFLMAGNTVGKRHHLENQEIQRVSILGAGALGAVYVTLFYKAGFSASVVARGERYERLVRDGLVVNGRHYSIPVLQPDGDHPPADLIIVAVKDHQLPEAVGDLKKLVGARTQIISVMNGLDSERTLAEVYGWEHVLYAIAVGIDALRQDNRVDHTVTGKIFFGEERNEEISPAVRRVQRAFERAGIRYETPVDMMRMLWWKFMVNVGMNQASAVMRASYGVFQSCAEARSLSSALMQEVIVLAKAEGINLSEKDIQDWDNFLSTLSPEGKTSMLQDIEAGRKTEVEIFGGKVVQLGKVHGIATPVNQTLLSIIRVLEKYPPI